MPATVDDVRLEGQDDDFTLVVALTQKDRPHVRYELRTQLSNWDFAEASLPAGHDGRRLGPLAPGGNRRGGGAAPGLPLPNGPGTVVVDLDRL